MSRLDCDAPPDSKQSGPLPGSFPLFLWLAPFLFLCISKTPSLPLPPTLTSCHFAQTELLLTSRYNFQFAESFLFIDQGVTPVNFVPVQFHIVSGRLMLLSLPQRMIQGSQNIWQLSMTLTSSCLKVQSSATDHRQEVGSQ